MRWRFWRSESETLTCATCGHVFSRLLYSCPHCDRQKQIEDMRQWWIHVGDLQAEQRASVDAFAKKHPGWVPCYQCQFWLRRDEEGEWKASYPWEDVEIRTCFATPNGNRTFQSEGCFAGRTMS